MGLRCCLFPNCFLKHRYKGVYPFLFLNQRTDNLETEVTCMTLFCAFEWKHFSLLIFWTCSQYHISQNSQQVLHRTLHSLRVKKMSYKVQERSYLLINVCVVWNQKMALQFTVASVFLVFIPFLTASIFPKYWFSQVEWCDVSGNRKQEFSELKGTGNASWSRFPEITVTEYIM